MTLREIFRFELAYQVRRVWTWLYFAVLIVVAYLLIKGNYIHDARSGAYWQRIGHSAPFSLMLNAPWVIAMVTVIGSQMAWLVAAPLAGDAAARDVQTRMHPLTYTTPISESDYLWGRFLAAFVLNALILLAVPAGILLAMHSPGVEPEILGPFRPAAYVSAYIFLALPNAFVGTTLQFSLAALSRRAMASYVGSVLLTVASRGVPFIALGLGLWGLADLLDPNGVIFVSRLLRVRTPMETNTHLIGLEGSLLANRLLWIGIALGILAFTHRRFRFDHAAESTR